MADDTGAQSPTVLQSGAFQLPTNLDAGGGVHAGMQLALHKEQLDQQQQQLSMQRQQHLMQVLDKHLDIQRKIGLAKGNTAYQKNLLNYGNQLAGIIGIPPMNMDDLPSVNQHADQWAYVHSRLLSDKGALQDPQLLQQYKDLYDDPVERDKHLLAISDSWRKRDDAQLHAASNIQGKEADAAYKKEIAAQSNATQQRGQDLSAQFHTETNRINDEYRKGLIDSKQHQDQISQQLADVRKQLADVTAKKAPSEIARNEGQAAQAEAGAGLKTTQADELPKSNAEKARHNKAEEDLKAQLNQIRAQAQKTRGSSTDRRTINSALTGIDNSAKNYRDIVGVGNRIEALLDQPDLTPGRFKESVTGLTAMMRGKVSQIPQGAENGLTSAYSDGVDKVEGFITRWLANNPGRDTISENSRQNLKADIHRLLDANHQQYRGVLAQGIELKRPILGDDIAAKTHKLYGTGPDDAGLGIGKPLKPMGGGGAASQQSGQLKQPTAAFLQGLQGIFGADKARLTNYLKGKGYDTSGVK